MTEQELAEALVEGATGTYRDEAAVRLLIDHGSWLRREDFVGALVEISDGGDDDGPTMAWVDWKGVFPFVDSTPCGGEARRRVDGPGHGEHRVGVGRGGARERAA